MKKIMLLLFVGLLSQSLSAKTNKNYQTNPNPPKAYTDVTNYQTIFSDKKIVDFVDKTCKNVQGQGTYVYTKLEGVIRLQGNNAYCADVRTKDRQEVGTYVLLFKQTEESTANDQIIRTSYCRTFFCLVYDKQDWTTKIEEKLICGNKEWYVFTPQPGYQTVNVQ